MRNPVRTAALLAGMTLMGVLPTLANPALRLQPPTQGCPVCELWLEYEDVVLLAQQEVGKLGNGVVYFYHAKDPLIIEPLIRFAYERKALEEAIALDPELRASLGGPCGHAEAEAGPVGLEITSSARGIFALLTSPKPSIVLQLENQGKRAVLSRSPVWF